jgi:hypothetical protein
LNSLQLDVWWDFEEDKVKLESYQQLDRCKGEDTAGKKFKNGSTRKIILSAIIIDCLLKTLLYQSYNNKSDTKKISHGGIS